MEVSRRLGASADTVRTRRRHFLERGMDGLRDEPPPGAPRKITDADVERVVVKTLEEKPKNATHWSARPAGDHGHVPVRDLADPAGVRPGPAPDADVCAVHGPVVRRRPAIDRETAATRRPAPAAPLCGGLRADWRLPTAASAVRRCPPC
ncbi:helix-turn-helix domain-containing protein [Streptomyces caelestis]|uniref:Helix-turn-helix domain-containing protein n=1 Tax=Streptomyces heliomycini TaxID=284032 RepID=A0ABV5L9G2_9ACTN|nr:helix-turn-helix domain-containing protein [Streptomyces sp. XY152]